jgi:hypothetical protein
MVTRELVPDGVQADRTGPIQPTRVGTADAAVVTVPAADAAADGTGALADAERAAVTMVEVLDRFWLFGGLF